MGNVTQAYIVKLSTTKEEECAMGKEGVLWRTRSHKSESLSKLQHFYMTSPVNMVSLTFRNKGRDVL